MSESWRCMFCTEPVTECPPVQELARLREENRRMKAEIERMKEEEHERDQ